MPKVDYALIAQQAQPTPDGLVTILGGGIDTLWTASLPAGFSGFLVLRMTGHPSEAARSHEVEIQVNDEDGHAILNMPIRMPLVFQVPEGLPAGWEVAAYSVGNLTGMPLEREGLYRFEILINGDWKRSLPFRVVIGAPSAPGQPAHSAE